VISGSSRRQRRSFRKSCKVAAQPPHSTGSQRAGPQHQALGDRSMRAK
jgi:hypothetical protein